LAVPVVASQQNAAAVASTSLSIAKPSGVAAGDLLIITTGSETGGASNGFDTPPSGFQLINYAGGAGSVSAFWRIADGTEADPVVLTQTIAGDCRGYYFRVTGARAVNPIVDVGPDYSNNSATVHNVPAITTTFPDSRAFVVVFGDSIGATFPTVSGWTMATGSTGGVSPSAGGGGSKSMPTPGSTGTVDVDYAGLGNQPLQALLFAVASEQPPPMNPRRCARSRPPLELLSGRVSRREGVAEDLPPRGRGPLFVKQRPPAPEALGGNVQRREGFAEDVYERSGGGARFVRQRPPAAGGLVGRARRREGAAEDVFDRSGPGPRFVRQAPPVLEALRGRVRRQEGVAEDDVAPSVLVCAFRRARSQPPLELLTGRVSRREGFAEDVYERSAPRRTVWQRPPALEVLRGRVRRQEGVAEDDIVAPALVGAIRRARSRPPLEALRGRASRREGVPSDYLGPYVASWTSGAIAGTFNLSLAKPSGVSVGDLLVIVAGTEGNPFSTPSGWTLIKSGQAVNHGSAVAFARIADGTESDPQVISQPNGADALGFYLRIVGAALVDPIRDVGSFYTDIQSTHTVPGITTTLPLSLSLAVLFSRDFSGTFPSVSGWEKATRLTGGGVPSSGGYASKSMPAAGATGDLSLNFGGSQKLIGFLFDVASAQPPLFSTALPRKARQKPFQPDDLRGRVVRREGFAEDFVPPVPRGVGPRTVRSRPPLEKLPGRVSRREGVAPDVILPRGPVARFVKQRPPRTEALRGRARRAEARFALVFFDRELSLRFDLDVFAPVTFRVYVRDVATGVETFIGTAEPGAMTIPGVALADGDYRIRVEGSGRYWRGARYAETWPVRIVGGELVQPLPAIDNLAAANRGDVVQVSWTLGDLEGFAMPEDFGVWINTSEPVDTSGAPDYVVTATGPGGYSLDVPESASTFFVAVAARRGVLLGPVSTIEVEPEEDDLDAPSGPSGRIPDGDWGDA